MSESQTGDNTSPSSSDCATPSESTAPNTESPQATTEAKADGTNPFAWDREAPSASAPPKPGAPPASGIAVVVTFTVLGLIGGIVGGMLLAALAETFQVVEPAGLAGTQGIWTAEQRESVRQLQVGTDYRNATLAMALLGLAVASFVGVAGGIVRRSGKQMLTGATIGAVTGVVAAGLAGAASVLIREQLSYASLLSETGEPNALFVQLHTMALHLPTWIGIAAASTLAACGLSRANRHRILKTFGAAVVGIVVATLLYPTMAALIFPTEHTDLVIPTGTGNRYLWATAIAGVMAFSMGRQEGSVTPTAAD